MLRAFEEIVPKTKILVEKVSKIKYFKYIAVTILFVLIITIVDSRSWLARIGPYRELEKMEAQKEYYKQKIETDTKRYHELKTNNENLEKFAREQYFMKKANEEIFVIEEEEEEKK